MNTREAQRRFYDLLWPHLQAVLRAAQILCGGDNADAEDLAQDTMFKAFKAIDRFAPGTDAKAWLLAILRNTRIDRLRAAATASRGISLDGLPREPEVPSVESEEPDRNVAEENPQTVLEAFSDQQIIDALQELPEEIRWTLLLVDVSGLDHKEASAVLEVPVGTIKSRAHRGRAMLRNALSALARERGLVGK